MCIYICIYIYIYRRGHPGSAVFALFFTHVSSTYTPLQPLIISCNYTWHVCNGHPNQKTKKPKNQKKQDCTPQPSAPDPLPLGCAILVFLFFLVFCFFGFLVWVVNAHVPSRIARHCQWLQRSACGRCFGRTGEISGRTLLFATFTLSGFANLCSIISCFGSLVLLENHVKTREKCMYFWGELKALGPGVGNSVIEVF